MFGATNRPVRGAGTRTGVGSGVGVGTGVGDGVAVGSVVGVADGPVVTLGAGWLAWAIGEGLADGPGLPRVVATMATTMTDAAATPTAPTLISRLNAVATPLAHHVHPAELGGRI